MADRLEVPLLDLRQQYARIREEIGQALGRVLDSQHFIMGPEVAALEDELARYCEVPHAVACASGSDAVLLAMMALGVGPGDEVICPSFTFFATAGSVWRLGARPVFADIDPATYNVDPESVHKAAAGRTSLRAIMPVHLYGQMAELDPLLALASDLGVPLVEDAAQAIGARDARGARAGSRGVIGTFSFYPTKNLGAYGDGGVLVCRDAESADRLRVLCAHGGRTRYHHDVVGLNSRLDALQAAVLRVKLPRLDEWSAARRAHAARYDAAFAAAGAADSRTPLADGGLPLRTPWQPPGPAAHIFHQYVIRVPAERRDALRAFLRERGVGSEVYYPLGLHQQPCFAALGYREGDLPETEAAAREVLALPIYPELSAAQLDWVVESVVAGLR